MSDNNHKSIWAAGFHAGPNKAQEDNDTMNHARFQSKYTNLSKLEQLTFDAVPIKECWSLAQVCSEVIRLGQSNVGKDAVERCLKRLVDASMVKAVGNSQLFTKDKPPTAKNKAPVAMVKAEPKKEPPKPLDLLYQCAESLSKLSSDLVSLAQTMESAVLQAEEQMNQKSGDFQKIEQLKSLLSELAPNSKSDS